MVHGHDGHFTVHRASHDLSGQGEGVFYVLEAISEESDFYPNFQSADSFLICYFSDSVDGRYFEVLFSWDSNFC